MKSLTGLFGRAAALTSASLPCSTFRARDEGDGCFPPQLAFAICLRVDRDLISRNHPNMLDTVSSRRSSDASSSSSTPSLAHSSGASSSSWSSFGMTYDLLEPIEGAYPRDLLESYSASSLSRPKKRPSPGRKHSAHGSRPACTLHTQDERLDSIFVSVFRPPLLARERERDRGDQHFLTPEALRMSSPSRGTTRSTKSAPGMALFTTRRSRCRIATRVKRVTATTRPRGPAPLPSGPTPLPAPSRWVTQVVFFSGYGYNTQDLTRPSGHAVRIVADSLAHQGGLSLDPLPPLLPRCTYVRLHYSCPCCFCYINLLFRYLYI